MYSSLVSVQLFAFLQDEEQVDTIVLRQTSNGL